MRKKAPSVPGANLGPRSRELPQPKGHLQLGNRDRAILLDLFSYGAMLRGQIQTLHFGSVARCNARLRQLFDAGLVERTFWPLSPLTASAYGGQAIYTLGKAGVLIVASILEWDCARVRERQRHGTPSYLAHALEIVNFRLALQAAIANQSAIMLTRFVPELFCHHAYEVRERGERWRQEVFKPDAVFLLERDGHTRAFALEIDLGHTSRREFGVKLAIHRRYQESGLFAGRYGVANGVTLCVTTSATRQANLAAVIKEQEHPCWVTTFLTLQEVGALAAIWQAPKQTLLASLLP